MGEFRRQLRWELHKLWRRPRTYAGFGACLLFEVLLVALYRLPVVRAELARHVWRLQAPIDLREAFSGLGIAVETTADTMMYVGALFLALVASDLVARELEDGTLRMVFCRPVSRTSVLAQKLIACAVYTGALALFIGASALVLGLACAGPGRLVVLVARDNLFGVLDFWTGLRRYALAVALLGPTVFTVPLLVLTLSCFPVKPGAAMAGALAVLLGDYVVNLHPAFTAVSPYTLATRLKSYRQVLNDDIPWLRLERNYSELLCLDLALLLVAWWVFRRRRLAPR
jgi:ABC-2 type transport system permease protein